MNDLVPHDQTEDGAVMRLPPQPGSMLRALKQRAAAIETSINTMTPEGEDLVIRCLAKTKYLAKQCVGRDHIVTAYLAHEIELTDQATGECFPAVRLVLVTDCGDLISTSSESLCKGWFDAIARLAVNGYHGPYEVQWAAVTVGEGKEYLQLVRCRRPSVDAKKSPPRK